MGLSNAKSFFIPSPMKVLWFTNTPSNYKSDGNKYNGGGWISSLEEELKNFSDVELGISFLMDGEPFSVSKNGVTYYPMVPFYCSKARKLLNPIQVLEDTDKHVISCMMHVIEYYKPDLIHVFGSEGPFGLIAKTSTIPVVLHYQGLVAPCYNAYLPPTVSWMSFFLQSLNPYKVLKNFWEKEIWKYMVERENTVLGNVRHVVGRTEFDYRYTQIMNPSISYHYGGEILRNSFYKDYSRTLPDKLSIVTTISSPLYKGFDLLLKTADILKNKLNIDFEWNVYGDIDPTPIEAITCISHASVNVVLRGVATAEQLAVALVSSTVYVHTSYIDNSPNSVCEAQILGVLPIATNVGGVSSIIENGATGILVPANDPYQLAYLINDVYRNPSKQKELELKAKSMAVQRHDKDSIVHSLIETYKSIING